MDATNLQETEMSQEGSTCANKLARVCVRARARIQVYVPRDMKMCMEMSKCCHKTHALGRHITTNNTNKHAHQVLKT